MKLKQKKNIAREDKSLCKSMTVRPWNELFFRCVVLLVTWLSQLLPSYLRLSNQVGSVRHSRIKNRRRRKRRRVVPNRKGVCVCVCFVVSRDIYWLEVGDLLAISQQLPILLLEWCMSAQSLDNVLQPCSLCVSSMTCRVGEIVFWNSNCPNWSSV